MINFRDAAFCLVLGALTSGCLLKEELHTWYIDPTGAVLWMVMEKDVRSDARAAFDRQEEESTYWSAVKNETHPMARGFRRLGAHAIRTRAVRAETPFTIITDGRFASLDELGQRLIVHAGLTGSSIVTKKDGTWEWTMTVRDPRAPTGAGDQPDEDLTALIAALDKLQVVLVSGRFEDATGFDLSQDNRIASFKADMPTGDDTTVTLMLRWR